MIPERRPTVADWRPATEPPGVQDGNIVEICVCLPDKDGKPKPQGAVYIQINANLLGFYLYTEQGEFKIDPLCWCPMPKPPTPEAIARGFAPE